MARGDKEFELKLAQTLYRLFDNCFSRPWSDLPDEKQVEWMLGAQELIKEMAE